MRIKALYSGKTYTLRNKEAVEYAIIDERDLNRDVAMLSREPTEGVVRFGDPTKGWVTSPVWEVREKLLIVTGIPRSSLNAESLIKLEDVKVAKAIPVKAISEALLVRGEELAKKLDEGGSISSEDAKVTVDGLEFTIMRVKACDTTDDLLATLQNLYTSTTVARKRVFFTSPVFIELAYQGGVGWYVVTLPRVLQYMRENPETVVQAGLIDENGFKAPYFIVRGLTVSDLGDPDTQRSSVSFLDNILRIGAGVFNMFSGGGLTGGTGAERPPVL